MNQILYTIDDDKRKDNVKRVKKVFAITAVIFGILILLGGAFGIYTQKKKEEEAIKPELSLQVADNQVTINVSHIRNVNYISYKWENEDEVTLQENKKGSIKETIDVPSGKNELSVKVVDEIGNETTESTEVAYDGTYMDLSVVNNNLKITVTDLKGLQSVTYKWNSDDAVSKYPETTNEKTMEIITSIPFGINTIEVSAVNNDNVTEKKQMQVQGITRPTVKVTYNTDRTVFNVKLSDDQGLKSYTYKLYNAKVEDVAIDGKLTEDMKDKLTLVASDTVELNNELNSTQQINLSDGFNYLEIEVINKEGATETLSGWCVK